MSPPRSAESGKKEYAALIRAAERLGLIVVPDEPLARHCTFRIGGPADLFVAADDIDTLERLAGLATEHDIPVTVLGGGSNVLISDRGVRGLVIANQTREFGMSESHPGLSEAPENAGGAGRRDAVLGPHLVADSGVALAGLARWAVREGWSGLEWAVSIPGTVGGAVVGNAGAHGGQIADNLAWVLVAEPTSDRQVLTADQLGFGYRDSTLKQRLVSARLPSIVLRAGFQLLPGDAAQMAARADSFLARRRTSQPVEPSAGSVFRNPPGDHAGRLIETIGLKGHRVGGVQVSSRHANFIINTGEGQAVEVAALIRLIQQRVYESAGVALMPEILYLGDWTGIE
jgi:UDP-N-acetylmuramate dehydrogenase